MKCLFAQTDHGINYPAYINLSEDENNGELHITVRTQGNGGTQVATKTLTAYDALEMAAALVEYARSEWPHTSQS